MFDKILIANRGEIACRIIKTARRMGVRCVAVYSDADANARHVRLADEAVWIGPSAARDSYLVGERIIAAAKKTGAQAIHPGYGFLSENVDFCAACTHAGLVFIGPGVDAIRAMGSKSEAKKLMQQARVPLTPGYHGDEQTPALLHAQADAIGYPVLIKAAAGGGGKGMRLVDSSDGFLAALAACQREAASSFGSEHVLVEKYLSRARHIEIQVFGDTHGNYVHLFERDCSVQRRHQKVLEEAPAPGMTPERRAAMGAAAVNAARAVGYVGAGTVEFIVAADGTFYFMEMNTRLQVEHPVTEMITGLDLVEWQLRVAAGEPLPLAQEQLAIRGHALEARIYAEDPAKGFLPTTGTLAHLAPPAESLHVRVDTGVEEGDAISPFYDPMVAKLIVWAENREQALVRMLQALADYRIVGVANNIDFLSRLVASPAFSSADLDTALIERENAYLFPEDEPPPAEVWLVAALGELLRESAYANTSARSGSDPCSPWHVRDGWRLNTTARRSLLFRLGGPGEIQKTVQVTYRGAHFALEVDGKTSLAHGELGARGQLRIACDGRRMDATCIAAGSLRHVFLHGRCWPLVCVDPLYHAGEGSGVEGGLTAPLQGRVIAHLAEVGAPLAKGAPLLILEAMKMEHTLTAPAAGRVQAFRYAVGEQVTDGVELVDYAYDQ